MIQFINIKANEMAQFTWKRRNGEVIDLSNKITSRRSPMRRMYLAIRKHYPGLVNEFREDLESRKERIEKLIPPAGQPLSQYKKPTAKRLFRKRK